MDYDKLIDDYRKAADKWEKRHPVTDTFDLRVQDALRDAATALSTLQAENEKLRAELEEVKRERDAAVECIETVYAKILIKCKTDAVRAIEKWKNKERSDNEV